MAEGKMDARAARTAASLERAIVALSSEKPAASLTVSEVAREAGVNRVTFYRHAESPEKLLGSILRRDLDRIRADDRVRRDDPAFEATDEPYVQVVLGEVAAHVLAYEPIYRRAFADPVGGAERAVLADHFTESARLHFRNNVRTAHPELSDSIDEETTARFIGHGLSGAVGAWLESGAGDRDRFVATTTALFPAWWS
ncbi:TetR/AcrR family transcriptional regulator [Agromyces seonyuensis]|uniref:TetR family transcriptional regulator n=1 Tax=Agromyces seonyuensis TaxID=2662446 RepID=A0A6I4NXM6_9MICO|nr:TetR/AcrR family transcriptional regulator [Agromyces seonyuensis]MWB99066.1 TetR family transcriptional regulator [Agromyces seonyuensis]